MMMIRLLIAADSQSQQLRQKPFYGLSDIILVGYANNVYHLVDVCANTAPTVLILDKNLLAVTNCAIAANIKQTFPYIRILLVVARSATYEYRDFLADSVDGFMTHGEYFQDAENAVRVLQLGGYWFSTTVLNNFCQSRAYNQHEEGADLTRREIDVLKLVAQGLTNKEIAHRLGVKERTIEFHVSNILQKLQTTSRVTTALWAKSHGFTED